MTPEETLQKSIEIAQKNGWDMKNFKVYCEDTYQMLNWFELKQGGIVIIERMLFDRSFREALVGKEFVYTKAMKLSTTGYVRSLSNINKDMIERIERIEIEVSIADYHLMMCAKSDDRISYVEKVLLSLGNK